MYFFIFALLLGLPATAAEEVRETWLTPVVIFGTQSELIEYPSEPQRLSSQKLENMQTTDVSRALKQVSGTYVREEDGMGLRPNIGLRGTNPDRSKKVTLMEDKILSGPAPYSAPAAYYTPSMLLTDNLEIYKGFSALGYGPNSIGGAVNYVTTSVFGKSGSSVKGMIGSFNSKLLKATTAQKFGNNYFLLEAAGVTTDGFKNIDNGGKTGFDQKHFQFKWGYNIPRADGLFHNIQLVLNSEDENSNETYLGITQSDFNKSFNRRYASSKLDLMKWKHTKAQIHHQYQISDTSTLETSLYRHDFQRTWYRLDRFRDNSVNIRDILNTPTSFNNYYSILSGSLDSSALGTNGELVMANNDRTYFSQGLQTKWTEQIKNHEIEIFARVHQDQIKRNHGADFYQMTSMDMVRTTDPRQTDTLNRESATAGTVFFEDHIRMSNWTLTPAFRYETVEFKFSDQLTGSNLSRTDDIFLPGLSIMNKLNSESALRVSANQASTLAGLSAQGNEKREEASVYEVEWNYMNKEASAEAQTTVFLNDYRNIIGTCTISSGCNSSMLDVQFNGGKALIYGVEAKAAKNFHWGTFDIPISANITYLKASFESDFTSTSPEWGVGAIRKGDPLPYLPEWLSSVSVGMQKGKYYQEITFSHQTAMYDQSAASGRKMIDGYGTIDLSANYSYSANGKIIAKIDNILAREYAVAARPFGLRPGKPQSFYVGIQQAF